MTPVFDPPEAAWRACIASVERQRSGRWQWCIADDGSTATHVQRELAELTARDSRVEVTTGPNQGIVAATNRALSTATGDIVVFLDHDDELSPDAVEAVIEAFTTDPQLGIAYSDEVLISADGALVHFYDKPDFSPERLRGHNYFAHLVAVDRRYAQDSGGVRAGFDGAQDNDFNLRAVEHFGRAGHIRRRLYRWRAVSGSVAAEPAAKPQTKASAERALREHCARMGIEASISAAPDAHFSFRVDRRPPDDAEVVVLVVGDREVPSGVTAHRVERVAPTAASADDGSLAAGVNEAVEALDADCFVLVSPDVVEVREGSVDELVALVFESDVAAAGPLLVRADDRVAAAGLSFRLAFLGGPMPVNQGNPVAEAGDWGVDRVIHEVSAVPAAGMTFSRSSFLQLGGLDEKLPTQLITADFGMRAAQISQRVLLHPYVRVLVDAVPTTTDAGRVAWLARWGDRADDERYGLFDREVEERRAAERWRHLGAVGG